MNYNFFPPHHNTIENLIENNKNNYRRQLLHLKGVVYFCGLTKTCLFSKEKNKSVYRRKNALLHSPTEMQFLYWTRTYHVTLRSSKLSNSLGPTKLTNSLGRQQLEPCTCT